MRNSKYDRNVRLLIRIWETLDKVSTYNTVLIVVSLLAYWILNEGDQTYLLPTISRLINMSLIETFISSLLSIIIYWRFIK